jgi:hypothetical protein
MAKESKEMAKQGWICEGCGHCGCFSKPWNCPGCGKEACYYCFWIYAHCKNCCTGKTEEELRLAANKEGWNFQVSS